MFRTMMVIIGRRPTFQTKCFVCINYIFCLVRVKTPIFEILFRVVRVTIDGVKPHGVDQHNTDEQTVKEHDHHWDPQQHYNESKYF
jgi:hypothetical protein